MIYRLIRNLLFLFDPEQVHYFAMHWLKLICRVGLFKKGLSALFQPKAGPVIAEFGLTFRNSIGLGAGFDKNASYLNELEMLGFGFVEIGTVTPLPQPGNDKPRLFRLPKDKALINRMGFNNEGVEAAAERLKKWSERNLVNLSPKAPMIIGGNIGKNKITPNELAWKDYEICFLKLHPWVDYFVVNVSSPNTPGLRALQEKDALHQILTNLQGLNTLQEKPKPILLKIAPDLSIEQTDEVIELALQIQLDGLVVSNTTISREGLTTPATEVASMGAGGLSGLPLKQKTTLLVKYIYEKTNGKIPIMASGGIFTTEDAREKLEAGARLLQVWTGFVYEGPAIVKKIYRNLYPNG